MLEWPFALQTQFSDGSKKSQCFSICPAFSWKDRNDYFQTLCVPELKPQICSGGFFFRCEAIEEFLTEELLILKSTGNTSHVRNMSVHRQSRPGQFGFWSHMDLDWNPSGITLSLLNLTTLIFFLL
ncbi:unnamed protein product [Pipistrellus nathusii]|uniref:Uncharacterized protein n=1 Tax=Pipistrellus nathusii TaxID=59473 RepID=A0ABN9ZB75_PIPNA